MIIDFFCCQTTKTHKRLSYSVTTHDPMMEGRGSLGDVLLLANHRLCAIMLYSWLHHGDYQYSYDVDDVIDDDARALAPKSAAVYL